MPFACDFLRCQTLHYAQFVSGWYSSETLSRLEYYINVQATLADGEVMSLAVQSSPSLSPCPTVAR